jgi:UDP-N-acetylglucosamine acyltransferase
MIGGVTGVVSDVIPFGVAVGDRAVLEGLNVIGMRRRKFTKERLHAMRSFYQKLFHGPGIFAERLEAAKAEPSCDPAATEILDFIGAKNHRSLCFPASGSDL